ncbi:hypothetical protein A6A06_19785 [Streptomyces sp. CB02923]|uniref:ANTAR domain-containing response regulator n=1 Tax=Streptomyces sp. CB02923 TaxID=1718985 RepID=UPI00093B4558|nr:hypothetical protein A6A06_19785 [Streptomyces sp. CB02923]
MKRRSLAALRLSAASGARRVKPAETPGGTDDATGRPDDAVVDQLRAENAQLRQALDSRPVIDQARGILMATESCTAEQAWDILRQTSQRTNTKVREVAGEVVAGSGRSAARRPGRTEPGPGRTEPGRPGRTALVRTELQAAVARHRAAVRRKAG